MSYTVLARRYRSSTFDEVIGQEHVAQTLKKAIESERVAHAYLFCGTRGVGKTSMARILAKALNCEKAKEPTAQPCGKCNSCLAIARGDDMDVIEIDAASNTQVEKTRDIIDNAQYRPNRSRFKVYIIDEVHMLSKSSFNALLKTLEEPPGHVKFILATTEPEKVLPTILSRCQRYDFKSISTREIAGHLKEVCKEEKVKADPDALLLIAKAGAGSMRDALSLLDRLLSVGEKELTSELIESLLGLPKSQLIFDLAQAIGEGDVKKVLTSTEKMIADGLSADSLIASMIEHLRNLLILRTCGADSELVEVAGLSMKELAEQAEQFEAVVLAQDIAILEELRRQMRVSQTGRALLDATLVRLALAEQFASISDLLASGNGGAPAPAGSIKKKSIEPLKEQAIAAPVSQARDEPAETEDDDDDLPRPGKVWEGPSLAETLKQQAATAARPAGPQPASVAAEPVSNLEPVSVTDLPGLWQRLLDALIERSHSLHTLVSRAKLVGIEDGRAVLQYAPQDETFIKMLERNGKKDAVRDVLTQVVGQRLGVRFEVSAGASVETATSNATATATVAKTAVQPPVRREVARSAEPVAVPVNTGVRITPELVESLRQREPLIKAVMDELGASVVKVEPAGA